MPTAIGTSFKRPRTLKCDILDFTADCGLILSFDAVLSKILQVFLSKPQRGF